MIQTANPLSEKAVREAPPAPTPERAGRWWRPLPHGDLVRAVRKAAKARAWSLQRPRIYVSPDGADMAASWDVLSSMFARDLGTNLSIGFRNSNSRTAALTVYGGVRTVEGPVVMFSAKLGQHRAGRLGCVEGVEEAFTQWTAGAATFAADALALRTQDVANEPKLLLEAGDKKLMPWSWLGRVHQDFRKGWPEKWRLLTCFGVHLGRNPPLEQMKQGHGFYKLVKEEKIP